MGRLGENQIAREVHGDKPAWWSSDEWETPKHVIDGLVKRYGAFDLDVCATERNAKAPKFYVKVGATDEGLSLSWRGFWWCNPPYSEPRKWVEKAVAETRPYKFNTGWVMPSRGIMLLPAAVDTHWFHDLVLPHADIEFIRGRIRFLGWNGTPIGSPTSGNLFAFFPKGWK